MLVSNIRLSYLKNGVWSSFTNQAENTMDGIKIQTNPNSSYYLKYRTWNEGRSDYYPYVTSTEDDFAGLSGRPIQRLQIQVYKNDGTKLTSGVVVMYRVKNGDQWIPWVSNADPEWMRSVQQKYNLGGTLAVDSVYAGNPGQNITGVQILVYEEGSLGDFTGGEVSASLSYMVGSLSNWSPFSKGALAPQMDGIKIQTSASKDYYLLYKTWNAGNSSYYPTVKSTEDDYAGYPGKAIQRLAIQVFRNDGTKLTSGVIVMYRAFAEGEWLPWVSNADPEWMRNAQNKYSLGGTLDVDSVYAGNAGQNISGVEIRIFEDDSYNAGSDNFSGSEINLNLSYMSDSLSNWTPFSRSVVSSDIDGIKIQTDSSQPFYLQYKSWNEGRSSYYPVVDSRGTVYNDYAGYPGQTIQLLSISAYSNDGTKLTSGVVIMYRVRVAGVWLPWVSNADPEWMQSVFRQYNLDGTLDTVSTYAGNKGQNIDGVEIRAFTGTTNNNPVGNLSGTEYVPSLSYMNDSLSNWTPFSGSVISSKLDGIKIQTDPSKPYYLVYKSWNAGRSGYYPDVKSTGTAYNDYAGYPGQPTQLLSIKVYRNDGVKLTTGVVVMYRVHIGDSWIPWVSNADPEWMRSVQNKYGLGGVLDYDAYYAGNKGQNINGIEIRIFEENGISDTPPTPSGPCKIIQAPFISQLGRYPTGCESVSSVMALNYAGYSTSVDDFIDKYLDKKPWPFDPNETFGGNPRLTSGWGCYTPVIQKAMNRILSGKKDYALDVSGMSIPELCSEYIDNDIPVIFWGTIDMAPPYQGKTWTYNGKSITWIAPLHCLLLVGYDDNNYIFNDPLKTNAPTYYSKESVELAYNGISKQAMVIKEKAKPTITQQEYDAGVRVVFHQGEYYLDYTIPLDNLFHNAKAQCEDHRCMSWEQYCEWLQEISSLLTPSVSQHTGMQLGSFSWFYGQVNHNKAWDIKREARWKEALPNVAYLGATNKGFLYKGKKISAEDAGNIMFGYTGRATGFSDVTLYWGGGVAAQGSLNNSEVNTPPYYGDDVNDHEMIQYGYELFQSEYPNYPEVGFEGIPVEKGLLAAIGDIILNPGT